MKDYKKADGSAYTNDELFEIFMILVKFFMLDSIQISDPTNQSRITLENSGFFTTEISLDPRLYKLWPKFTSDESPYEDVMETFTFINYVLKPKTFKFNASKLQRKRLNELYGVTTIYTYKCESCGFVHKVQAANADFINLVPLLQHE